MNKFIGLSTFSIAWKKMLFLLKGKQDTLVSGDNIKTINGQSILGCGDITVEGTTTGGGGGGTITLDDIDASASAHSSVVATATVTKNDNTLAFEFGIPAGAKGDPGSNGDSWDIINGYWYKNGTNTGLKAVATSNNGETYNLPTATKTTKGGIKIGNYLSMNGEILSVDRDALNIPEGGGGGGGTYNTYNTYYTTSTLFLFKTTPLTSSDVPAYGKLPNITYNSKSDEITEITTGSLNGWGRKDVTPGKNEKLWMIYAYFDKDGEIIGTWYGPWVVASNGSSNGEDNEDLEYAFILTTGGEAPTSVPEIVNSTAQDVVSFQPNRTELVIDQWTDSPQGITEEYPKEYAIIRVRPDGTWCDPFIWSAWGRAGLDGDGVQYIFKSFESVQSAVTNPTPSNWESSSDYQDKSNEYVPDGWVDDPPAVSSTTKAVYVSQRKYDGTQKKWLQYSAPKLWSVYVEAQKLSTQTIAAYCFDTNGDKSDAEVAFVNDSVTKIREAINNNTLGALTYAPNTYMANNYSDSSLGLTWRTTPPTSDDKILGYWYVQFVMTDNVCTNANALTASYIGGDIQIVTEKGDDAVYADLTNEMDALFVDENNKTTTEAKFQTSAELYYGLTQVTSISYDIKNTYMSVNSSDSTILDVTIPKGTTVDGMLKLDVTVSGTASGKTISADLTYKVVALKQGSTGSNAVIYKLVPDPNSITFDKKGKPSVDVVKAYLNKIDGTTYKDYGMTPYTNLPSNMKAYYNKNETGKLSYDGQDISTSDLTSLSFFIELDGIVIEKETIQIVHDGSDGISPEAPIGEFTSYVFARVNLLSDIINKSNSSTDTTTIIKEYLEYITPVGGSYSNSIPTGFKNVDEYVFSIENGDEEASYTVGFPTWTDGIPPIDTTNSTSTVIMSACTFKSDGTSGEWSTPIPMSDTDTIDRCFSASDNRPSAPTTHGTQKGDNTWYDITQLSLAPSQDVKWMATSEYKDGAWSDWIIVQIKGEDGNAQTPDVKFVEYVYARINEEELVQMTKSSGGKATLEDVTPYGGDYDSPLPTRTIFYRNNVSVYNGSNFAFSEWADGFPTLTDDNKAYPIYESTREYHSKDASGDWTTPRPVLDSDTNDICFSQEEQEPKPPTTHWTQNDDNSWYDASLITDIKLFPNGFDAKWRAESICTNGVWSDWVITRIVGEKGDSVKGDTGYHLRPRYFGSYSATSLTKSSSESAGVSLSDTSWRSTNGAPTITDITCSDSPISLNSSGPLFCFVSYAYEDADGNLIKAYDDEGNISTNGTCYWSIAGFFTGYANNAGIGGKGLDGMPGINHRVLYGLGSATKALADDGEDENGYTGLENNVITYLKKTNRYKDYPNVSPAGISSSIDDLAEVSTKVYNDSTFPNGGENSNYGYLWLIQFEEYYTRVGNTDEFTSDIRNVTCFRGTPLDADTTQSRTNLIAYSAGVWDPNTEYTITYPANSTTTGAVPYVTDIDGKDSTTYAMYILNGVSGKSKVGTHPYADTTNWTKIPEYDVIYSKLLLAGRGQIGEMAFYGDWFFSVEGANAEGVTGNYDFHNFEPIASPTGEKSDLGKYFIPNFAFNAKTGNVYLNGGKSIFKYDGSGSLADGKILWNENGVTNLGNAITINKDGSGYIGTEDNAPISWNSEGSVTVQSITTESITYLSNGNESTSYYTAEAILDKPNVGNLITYKYLVRCAGQSGLKIAINGGGNTVFEVKCNKKTEYNRQYTSIFNSNSYENASSITYRKYSNIGALEDKAASYITLGEWIDVNNNEDIYLYYVDIAVAYLSNENFASFVYVDYDYINMDSTSDLARKMTMTNSHWED